MENKEYDLSKYPKFLETYEDYEFIRKMFPKKIWEEDFKQLIADSFEDVPVAKVVLDEENPDTIKNRIDFRISTKKEKDSWVKIAKRLKNLPEENISELATSTFKNGNDFLGTNEIFKEVLDERGVKKLYIYRNIEKPNSKIRRIGYTPEQVIDYICSIDETELKSYVDTKLKEAGINPQDALLDI